MRALHVTLHAFRAEHPPVERKLLPWFKSNHLVVPDFELNPTLLAAETTVRLNELLRGILCFALPSAGRFVIQMRPIAVDQSLIINRRSCHEAPSLNVT